MKIDNNNPNPLNGPSGTVDSLKPTQGPAPAAAAGTPEKTAAPADQLTLSPEARLLQTATDAAAAAPDIRHELVERMRALLDRGDLGADAGRLADALINDVLEGK